MKSKPSIFAPLKLYTALVLGAVLSSAPPLLAQESDTPWNRLYAIAEMGQCVNLGSIEGRDGYSRADLPTADEWGFGLGLTSTKTLSYELTLVFMEASVMQGKSGSADYLDTNLNSMKLSGTAHFRVLPFSRRFVAWWGPGFDINSIDIKETEVLAHQPEGTQPTKTSRDATAIGGHIGGGLDFYPVPQSAFALTLEGRGTFYLPFNTEEQDLSGVEFLIGLKWDFWHQ